MKILVRTALLAATIVYGAGCVEGDTPLLLNNVLAFDEECGPADPDELFKSNGALNTALSPTYFSYVDLESQLLTVEQPGPEGSTVSSGNANDVIVDEVEVDYRSTPDLGLQPESYPTHFVIQAAGGFSRPVVSFFPTRAAETLTAAVVQGDRIVVEVGVRFTGQTRSGMSMESNRIVFPITVTNEPVACPTGTTLVIAGCGSAGSDSAVLTCE